MTLANAPHMGKDARISASDLPDGTSEIFLRRRLDSGEPQDELICPSGCGPAHAGRDPSTRQRTRMPTPFTASPDYIPTVPSDGKPVAMFPAQKRALIFIAGLRRPDSPAEPLVGTLAEQK